MPKVSTQVYITCLTAKFGSFLDHAVTGEKGQNVISSSVQHPITLIFAIHVSFIIPLPMMWVLLTKPMQKSVITSQCVYISTTGYTRKSRIIILLYFVLTSPHSSITTLLVNFGRSFFFSLHHHLLHRLCFARSIRQKMLCREERSLWSWGKRQKAWKLAAIGFTQREIWADFQDFWSNFLKITVNLVSTVY